MLIAKEKKNFLSHVPITKKNAKKIKASKKRAK